MGSCISVYDAVSWVSSITSRRHQLQVARPRGLAAAHRAGRSRLRGAKAAGRPLAERDGQRSHRLLQQSVVRLHIAAVVRLLVE